MAAGLQQREHQRGELVAHRHAGETHPRFGSGPAQGERGLASASSSPPHVKRDQIGHRLDVVQQFEHLARLGAVVERGDDLDGLREPLQVALQLRLEVAVEHGVHPRLIHVQRSSRAAGRATRSPV